MPLTPEAELLPAPSSQNLLRESEFFPCPSSQVLSHRVCLLSLPAFTYPTGMCTDDHRNAFLSHLDTQVLSTVLYPEGGLTSYRVIAKVQDLKSSCGDKK